MVKKYRFSFYSSCYRWNYKFGRSFGSKVHRKISLKHKAQTTKPQMMIMPSLLSVCSVISLVEEQIYFNLS